MSKEAKETKPAVGRSTEMKPLRPTDIDTMFDRMFGSSWFRPLARPWLEFAPSPAFSVEAPALDVYEEKDALVVKAEIPGLDKEDINVSVTDSMLTIKGEKKREEEVKEKDYYRCERSFGAFSRSVKLPSEVKADAVKATFKNGVLEVRLPKTEAAKNSVVRVKVT